MVRIIPNGKRLYIGLRAGRALAADVCTNTELR